VGKFAGEMKYFRGREGRRGALDVVEQGLLALMSDAVRKRGGDSDDLERIVRFEIQIRDVIDLNGFSSKTQDVEFPIVSMLVTYP